MGWDYCCCAIPILNVGAYITLSEQFVLGILVGTLSLTTPALVGTSLPFSFAHLVLSLLGFAFALIQFIGFIGIFKEKPNLFRRYVSINWIVLSVGLSAAATFIGISASRHSRAVATCEATFFNESDAAEDDEGEQVCEIFCWISVGVMGGLWLLLTILQSYFVLVLRNYGVTQRVDHTKYHSIYSTNDADGIVLNERSGSNGNEDAWNARPSTDSWHPRGQNNYRDDEPGHSRTDSYDKGPGYGVGAVVPPAKQASVDQAYLEHPSKAYTDDPEPTPYAPSMKVYAPPPIPPPSGAPPGYYTQEPEKVMHHPAEGSFGRKTPRQNSGPGSSKQPYNPYYPS